MVLLGVAGACTSPPSDGNPTPRPSATAPASLRVGAGTVDALDPAELDTPESLLIASQVFDGLVRYDPGTAAVVPAVATDWEVLDGGSRFVFHLGPSVFHDQTLVTAESFAFAWRRLADPATPRPFAFLLESVAGFRDYRESLGARPFSGLQALDERTLEVRLRYPWPDFVALLGHPALSPVPAAAQDPAFGARPIGNGPYRLTGDLALGQAVRLEAFEGYPPGLPPVRSVEFLPVDAPEEAWPDFLSGALDVAPIPPALIDQAQVEFGTAGIETVGRLLYCGFNLSLKRFQDPALRRAVSMAIDRAALVREVFAGGAEPATGIVPPSFPGSRADVCGEACTPAVEEARAVVAGLPEEDRTFSLDFAQSDTGALVAEGLAAQLGEAGFVVTPRGHSGAEYADLLSNGEQAFFCLTAVADYPRQRALLEPLLLSSSPDNRTGIADDELDALLERARGSFDPIAREDLYLQAERRALELMPLVPIAWFREHLAAKPFVTGLAVDPLGTFDVAALSIAA